MLRGREEKRDKGRRSLGQHEEHLVMLTVVLYNVVGAESREQSERSTYMFLPGHLFEGILCPSLVMQTCAKPEIPESIFVSGL